MRSFAWVAFVLSVVFMLSSLTVGSSDVIYAIIIYGFYAVFSYYVITKTKDGDEKQKKATKRRS